MSLQLQDTLYTILHLLIIGFNLLGWIWKPTRRAHLVLIILTALSWFVLGIWHGIGYCPITDWQWSVKRRLGETHLPNSFIKYFADKLTGADIPPSIVDTATLISFVLVFIFSIYLNYKDYSQRKISSP